VGYVTANNRARIAQDVGGDMLHYANPDLPETRCEMAVPLTLRGQVIGALDVQSLEINAFNDEDVAILQTLADQLAVAIDNARLFEATQHNLEELQELQRQTRRQASFLAGTGEPLAYRYDGVAVQPTSPETQIQPTSSHDVLHIPLRLGDEDLGTLELKREGEIWAQDDLELTVAVAERMALALENARLFDQAQRRAQQLSTLSEMAAEISGPQFSQAQLLDSVLGRALTLLNADGGGLFLPTGPDEIELKAVHNLGEQMVGQRLRRGEGLSGKAFATGKVVRIDDYQAWSGQADSFSASPFRAVMSVPIVWQHDVLGVLALSHHQPGVRFSADDQRAAVLFATQAAAAIENVRLLEETQARIGELATINNIGQALSSQLELSTLVELVGEAVRQAFRVSAAYVAVYDREANLIEVPYASDGDQRLILPPFPPGEGLTSYIINTRRPARINTQAEVAQLGKHVVGSSVKSYLGVPLLSGDHVIGVLSAQSTEQESFFSESDQRVLVTIAANVSVAIQNARLFEQTQARVAELAAINSISQAINSQLNLRAMLYLVGEKIQQTFGVPDAYIALYDSRSQMIEIPYFAEENGQQFSIPPMPLGKGVTSLIIKSRQPLLINQDAELRLRELGAEITGAPAKSYLGVPMIVGDEAIGVISVQSLEHEGLFGEADQRLLTTIASTVAVAIQNVRLFEQTQQRARELEAINTISLAASAQLDLHALLNQVGEKIRLSFEAPLAYIALYDRRTNRFEIPYGVDGDQRISLPPTPLGEGVSSFIIQSRQPLLINRDTGKRLAELGAIVTGVPAKSFLGVPMIAGDEVIGVISVQNSEQEGLFTQADLRLLTTMAATVSVAVQNARLFADVRQSAEQLGAINRVTTAATALDLPSVLQATARELVQIFNARNSGIALLNPDRTHLVVTADYSANPDELGTTGLMIPLANNPSSLQVLETGQSLVVLNAQTNPLTEPIHDLMRERRTECLMIVPLRVRGEVIGTIGLDTDAPERKFTAEEVSLTETIAGQIAGAIENARLFAETKRRAEQLATAAEVSRVSISMLNPDELIVQTVELIRERFDLYYTALFLVDEAREWAVLRHATGEAGQQLLARNHKLEVGGQSMIGQAVARRQARIALDVGLEPVRFANPFLPDTRSELALPLAVGETVLGALSVQSTQPNAFGEADIAVLQTMADQIAIALRNAQLLNTTQRNQAFLDSVVENLPAMLYVKDAQDLSFVRFNKAGEELLGLSREAMLGKNDYDFFPQDEADFFASKDREVLDQKAIVDIPEEPIQTRHQGRRTLYTRKVPILDAAGNPQYLLGFSLDITERKRAEALLANQQQVLEFIAQGRALPEILEALARFIEERSDRAKCSILLLDSDGKHLRLGAAPSLPASFIQFADGWLIGPRAGSCGTAAYRGQQVISVDIATDPLWVDFADGFVNEQGLRSCWSTPILSIGGQVLGTFAMYYAEPKTPGPRDCELIGVATRLAGIAIERAQAESVLRESEAKHRLLLNSIQSPVLALSDDMRVLYANEAYAQLNGAPIAELEGQNLLALFPEFRQTPAYKAYGQALTTGKSQEVEGAVGDRYLRSRVYRTPQGVLAIADDITERRRVEEEIVRRNKELANLNRVAQRRAQLLAAAAEIGRAATSTLDLDVLLRTSVELIRDRFGFYHASVFIVEPGTDLAVLRESTGEAGRELKARRHRLAIGSKSLVGAATATRQPVIVQDVTEDPTHFKNPLLPDTRAEAVLPLLSGDRVMGALDVQSTMPSAFGEDDIAILTTIADQLAVAVQNARLFDQTSRQAQRERLVGEITGKIRAANDIDSMLRVAVSELRTALGVSHGAVRLSASTTTAEAGGTNTLKLKSGNGATPPRTNGSGDG
jgi:PAS domain S-box-containing protein